MLALVVDVVAMVGVDVRSVSWLMVVAVADNLGAAPVGAEIEETFVVAVVVDVVGRAAALFGVLAAVLIAELAVSMPL